jgi:F-type H+-transporting ATPase subunit gamma
MAVDEFCSGKVDQVCLIYTRFINMMHQEPTIKGLLPLRYDVADSRVQAFSDGKETVRIEYTYEPDPETILGQIVPRFTALQVYQAIMTSLASEHAARMVSMRNATENAEDLGESLQLEYNKARQKAITREMLDIVGGAEAL